MFLDLINPREDQDQEKFPKQWAEMWWRQLPEEDFKMCYGEEIDFNLLKSP